MFCQMNRTPHVVIPKRYVCALCSAFIWYLSTIVSYSIFNNKNQQQKMLRLPQQHMGETLNTALLQCLNYKFEFCLAFFSPFRHFDLELTQTATTASTVNVLWPKKKKKQTFYMVVPKFSGKTRFIFRECRNNEK